MSALTTGRVRLPARGRLALLAVVASLVIPAGSVRAQIPAAPAVPGAPALPGGPVPAGAAAPAATPAAGGGGNLWSFFMKTPAQKAQCQACICGSPLGQMLSNMMAPAALMTGGLLKPMCPGPNTPSAADLAKPASSAQGAAAKIKAEEAQAKAKIAALEYLAGVDCRYYPEAQAAMIAALRGEKNECVRLAAAKALAFGCCCSAKVVKALTICVNCSSKDGFPAEASELVRAYAFVALERCLMKCVQGEPDVPPEPPPAAKKAMYETIAPMGGTEDYNQAILLAAYFSPDSTETTASLYLAARQTLAKGMQLSPKATVRLAGPRNVRDSLFPGPGKVLGTSAPTSGSSTQVQTPTEASSPDPKVMPAVVTETREPSMAANTTPKRDPGRGNLLNIFQDALKH